ncbi:unnamed protein product [Echinostoma caproni]|uniref:Uncharacterized protein n=1 Tax=Echinostoma caproni TaxID=27848 RepID=A0A183AZJ1_9TREM|nr:unnamed protein product [Echinostoma caproni]
MVPGVESKRRRTDTAEYIKKRFLYDVEDEARRLKNRKPRAPRLPTATVSAPRRSRLQMKQGWHNCTSPEGGLLPLRSRRGRRVKLKQDYSSMSHENEGSPNYAVEQASPRRLTKKRRGKRGRRKQVVPEPEVHQRRSTWELPDLFNADDNDQMDELSQAESSINDAHKQRFPDTTDLLNYSDVLLHSIPSRTTILGGTFDDHDRRKRTLREHLRRCDQRKIRHRHPASPSLVQKGSNAFHHGSLLSPGHSSDAEPHPQDVMDFCTEPTADQFRRRQEFDEFEHTEDEYIQYPGSRAPSEEQNQTPHEELEEEELLAPELSLLAGQSDNGNLISGSLSNCGGSRRKSPVRPMQVLRTKSHSTVTSGSQAPILVSNSDENPFIFHSTAATAGGYSRQHPGGDDYMPTVLHSTVMEKNSEQTIGEAHFRLKAASVLRLLSSSNTGASAIAIRSIPEHTLQLPVSTEC